jgi:hypothetical protein
MLADEQTVKRNKTRARLILGLEHRRNTNPLELLLWGASTKKKLWNSGSAPNQLGSVL